MIDITSMMAGVFMAGAALACAACNGKPARPEGFGRDCKGAANEGAREGGLGSSLGSCDVVAQLDAPEQSAAFAATMLPGQEALVALEPAEPQPAGRGASNAYVFGAGGTQRVELPQGGGTLVTAISDAANGVVFMALEGSEQGLNTVNIARYGIAERQARAFTRLADTEPEPMYAPDGRQAGGVVQPSSKIMRSALQIPHVRLLTTSDGGLIASIAADQSLKILRYDREGEPLGKLLLLPVVKGQPRFLLAAALIARSGDRLYAAFPVSPDDEGVVLAFHGVDPGRGRARGGYLVLEISASTDILSVTFIASPAETTLRPSVIDPLGDDVYVAGDYVRGPADAQPFVDKLARLAPAPGLARAWSSVLTGVRATASVFALEAMEDRRLVLGGMEGAQQAASGSVLNDSPAYVALYDELVGMQGKLSWGRGGRNFVLAASATSSRCELRIVSTEGHPLTHEDGRARTAVTVLSTIRIGGCSR